MHRCREKRHRRKLVPIFAQLDGKFIANIIKDCTAVQIDENDGLPSAICHDCFETVKLLEAFAKTTRDCDAKLRNLYKTEPSREQSPGVIGSPVAAEEQTESKTTVTHFLEIKCEPFERIDGEEATLQDDDFEPENDTDVDWKKSDEQKKEEKRTVKRKQVGLKSKPKPRQISGSPAPKRKKRKRIQRLPLQKEEDFLLTEREQELFTSIEIKPEDYVCCGCLQVFGSAGELEAHRKTVHIWKNESLRKPTSKLFCEGCLRRFNSAKSLNYHQERVRLLKAVWECKKCNIRFKVVGKRREHAKLHPEGEPVAVIVRVRETTKKEFGWVCCARRCSQSFTNEDDLLAHSKVAHWIEKQAADLDHPDRPEQCQVCFQRFADKKRVMHHQRRKYKFNNFQCALCGLKFGTTEKLTAHEANEHNEGAASLKCKVCQKTFRWKSTLTKHIEYMHEQDKQHQCTICGWTFRQKVNLVTHMSQHVEVPQFKCEICLKMFKAKLHLRYHMRTHTGEKPYKCQYCDSFFANHTNYRRHEMTHTGDKPHKCSYCEKSFILKRTLVDHESTHTGAPKQPRNKASNQRTQQTSMPVEQSVDIVEVDDVPDQASSNENSNQESSETVQSTAIAVYNILPSTSGSYGYVLKY